MARIKIIRGTNLPNSASKADCHNLVDDATGQIYDIVNSEVKSDAAIVDTKLATISTIGKVNLSALVCASAVAGDILYIDNAGSFARLPIGTAGQKLRTTNIQLDFMEYSTDALAQAAYVSNDLTPVYGSDVLTGGVASADTVYTYGYEAINACDNNDASWWSTTNVAFPHWWKYDLGGGVTKIVRKLEIKTGLSEGNATLKDFTLEGSNNDYDWTTIYTGQQANNTDLQTYTFANSTAYRYYRIVVTTSYDTSTSYCSIYETSMYEVTSPGDLQSYSEATIKTQGSYSLKGVAVITGSLNSTLTRTVSPTLDLTGKNSIRFDIRSSRTGSNIKIGIHDSGGTTTEITPNITSANAWQTVTWDISGVSDANKNVIDSIIITIVNADAANTFYLDYFATEAGAVPLAWVTP